MLDDLRPAHQPDKSVPVKIDNTQTKIPDTATFIPPDQMASIETDETSVTLPVLSVENDSWRLRLAHSWHHDRRQWLTGMAIMIGVAVGTTVLVWQTQPKPVVSAVTPVHVVKIAPKPTTVASTLSGLPVDPGVNQRPVTGVMIENSLQARPQSGLSQANVVFEAIAEGGITRFLALFQDTNPDTVGPIRSARPYYEQWALGFDAGYSHVGGSPEALANIKAWGVRDLDQFANSGSYHRVSNREAPHNVYTSIAALNQLEAGKGYTTSKFSGFARKTAAATKQPTAKSINLAISGPLYNVHYDYNAVSNSYNRSEGGQPHIDAATNQQLSPTVVIAMVMPYSLEADGYHSSYNTLGTGIAYIFQDGAVTVGQWAKPDNATQISFIDGSGQPMKLNPGQTWLSAVRAISEVNYAP